jgi:ABC-type multidrug transport system fused ATPase/permease subunit
VGQELNRFAKQSAQMKAVMDAAMQRARDQGTQTQNEVFQVRQRMDAIKRMVRQCQGAWVSVRELFALLDKAVGVRCTLPGMKRARARG